MLGKLLTWIFALFSFGVLAYLVIKFIKELLIGFAILIMIAVMITVLEILLGKGE